MTDRPWFESAFDRVYLDLYAHRDDADALRAIKFLRARGLLSDYGRVLDLCCGNGRHSEALQAAMLDPVGIDLSHDLLHDFHQRVGNLIPKVRADMRHLPLGQHFDLVVNLFTSFGYFDDDDESWQVIREVHRVLRPGGAFVMDFLNAPRVRATLVPESERDIDEHHRAVERREITVSGHVVKRISLQRDGEVIREWEESVRLLGREEITAAMLRAGFVSVEAFGDFAGSEHTDASERLILLASRGE